MLQDETYRIWTAAFHAGSYYIGNWEEGSDIRFLGPSEDGTEGGMIGFIKENRPYEFISIEYRGMIMNDVEDFDSEAVKGFVGAHENYTFIEKDGGTEVLVEIDAIDEYKAMFEDTWPKALQALKELVERD